MKCPSCQCEMHVSSRGCTACGVEVKGRFYEPRLARLSPEMQRLAELFLLNGGNLKELAPVLDVSYPTLRKRVDVLVNTLRTMHEEDQQKIASWLQAVERGEMTAEIVARMIREINGES